MTVLRMLAALVAGYALGGRSDVSEPRRASMLRPQSPTRGRPRKYHPTGEKESGRVAWRPPSTAKTPMKPHKT